MRIRPSSLASIFRYALDNICAGRYGSQVWDVGGDKRDRWQDFYADMIPLADDLFDEHLKELEGNEHS